MNELTIQSHKFDKAKNELKKFSERIPSTMDLESVSTHEGLFNWFEHNVKGDELNKLTAQIQTYLISINETQKKSIKEFGQVYQALEALDKDYIQYILISIKAAEKASLQAKKSADEAKKNSFDIEKTIEVQKKTIDVLAKFKNQIDNYKHLVSIDEIWIDSQRLKKDVESINGKIKNQADKFNSVTKVHDTDINTLQKFKEQLEKSNYDILSVIEVHKKTLSILTQFKQQVDKYEHLQDVDELWNGVKILEENVESIRYELKNQEELFIKKNEGNRNDIIKLLDFRRQLEDFNIHDKLNELCGKTQTIECDIIAITNDVHRIRQNVEEEKKEYSEYNEQLKRINANYETHIKNLYKKLNISYLLTGSSIGIALISVILNILGVI